MDFSHMVVAHKNRKGPVGRFSPNLVADEKQVFHRGWSCWDDIIQHLSLFQTAVVPTLALQAITRYPLRKCFGSV